MVSSQRKGLRSAHAGPSTSGGGGSEPTPGPSTQSHVPTGSSAMSQLNSQLSQVQVTDEGSSDNDNDDPEAYGDMHKLVLQGMMAAGYLDAKGVKKLFQESCKQLGCKASAEDHQSPPFIQKVVREINERIKTYDMVIRSATCEITGGKFYVLLVTIEKQVMKLQTYFTKTELELFQKILDSLLRKHKHFAMSMTECINMGGDMNVRGFAKLDAEDFVERMISLQYFTKVNTTGDEDDFEITLGFRTIREFEPIFRECYQDCFTNCCLCKMILLNGLQCQKCSTVIHRACLRRYIQNCKMCVTCKGPWRTEKALVVRKREGGDEPTSPEKNISPGTRSSTQDTTQSQGPSTSKRARINFTGEVDMPILEPMVSPGSAGTTQSKSQLRMKKKNSTTTSPAKEVASPSPKKRAGPASSKQGGGRPRKAVISSDSDSD